MDETDLAKNLIEIINSIEGLDWNKAKTIWFINVCKAKIVKNCICAYGSEYEHFSRYLRNLQVFKILEICQFCNYDYSPKSDQNYLFFMRNCNNDFILNKQTNKKCNRCDKDYECAIKFFKDLCCLICEIDAQTEAYIESLTKSVMLKQKL